METFRCLQQSQPMNTTHARQRLAWYEPVTDFSPQNARATWRWKVKARETRARKWTPTPTPMKIHRGVRFRQILAISGAPHGTTWFALSRCPLPTARCPHHTTHTPFHCHFHHAPLLAYLRYTEICARFALRVWGRLLCITNTSTPL